MELVQKQLGPVAVDVALKDGALVAELKIPLADLLDMGAAKVKAAIPGQIDDAVIDVVVSALKAELMK